MALSSIETILAAARLNRRAIPDVPVVDHTGRAHRFYSDLVRGRRVLIGFSSIAHDVHYPCAAKMAQVRGLLDRIPEDDTALYTLTVDPEVDTPERIAWWARAHGVGAGVCGRPGETADQSAAEDAAEDAAENDGRWRFLTGRKADIEAIRSALFVHRERTGAPAGTTGGGWARMVRQADLLRLPPERAVMECSMGLLRYGDESLDIWGGAPVRARAEEILSRLAWVRPADGSGSAGGAVRPRRRGGPRRATVADIRTAAP